MRKLLFISIATNCLISCVSMNSHKSENQDMSGIYLRQESTEKLELKFDGTYILFNPKQTFTPVFEYCEIASKGRWTILSIDVLELTSEDKYLKQKGFEYEIKKENKFSQDSLYIQVNFPTDFHPVKLNFYFNSNTSKASKTEKTFIALPKSKHLWDRNKNNTNCIYFSVDADISGTTMYKSRILFRIFEEYIDTEKTNFLTISLPNFDRCFFEFEPLNKELINIKSSNKLFWQGDIWKK